MIVSHLRRLGAPLALVAAVAACSPYAGPAEHTGTATGAVVGAVVGSTFGHGAGRVAATMIGATAGGIIGNRIGYSMDREAEARAMAAEQWALANSPPGTPYPWREGEYYGSVEAGPPMAYAGNPSCRQYTHTIYIDGKPRKASGTACKGPDGSWQTMG